jgi:hypothetical protein
MCAHAVAQNGANTRAKVVSVPTLKDATVTIIGVTTNAKATASCRACTTAADGTRTCGRLPAAVIAANGASVALAPAFRADGKQGRMYL